MALHGGIPTRDTPFLFPSLAPAHTPDATERTLSIPSPSKIQKVCKEKEEYKERCNPFFNTALDQLEAKQVEHFCPHLQQTIEDLYNLYEDAMYTKVMEDFNAILLHFSRTTQRQRKSVRQYRPPLLPTKRKRLSGTSTSLYSLCLFCDSANNFFRDENERRQKQREGHCLRFHKTQTTTFLFFSFDNKARTCRSKQKGRDQVRFTFLLFAINRKRQFFLHDTKEKGILLLYCKGER